VQDDCATPSASSWDPTSGGEEPAELRKRGGSATSSGAAAGATKKVGGGDSGGTLLDTSGVGRVRVGRGVWVVIAGVVAGVVVVF